MNHKNEINEWEMIQNFSFHQIELLTKEEEQKLWYRLLKKDKAAEKELMIKNMSLVKTIASHFITKSLTFDDLMQEGVIGLLKAIRKFDVRKGYRFSSYATVLIYRSISRAIQEQDQMIYIPEWAYEMNRKREKLQQKLTQENQEEPKMRDIAKQMNVEETFIQKIAGGIEPISLETKVYTEDLTLKEIISNPSAIDPGEFVISELIFDQEKKEPIKISLSKLTERERTIICLRFCLNGKEQKSLKEIGILLGLSGERIRQIEAEAIQKLYSLMKEKDVLKRKKKKPFKVILEIPSLYELLKEYEKEEIDTSVSLLMEEDKIHLRGYKGNYGFPFKGTQLELEKITKTILPKLQSLIEYRKRNHKMKTLRRKGEVI